jgi:hypothetical protein
MCSYFGQKDELFNYRLMGTHPTMSGMRMLATMGRLAAQSQASRDHNPKALLTL